METVDLICTLLFLGLIAWFLIGTGKKRAFGTLAAGTTSEGRLPLSKALVLWGLALALTALRLWRFGAAPGGFNQDGAMAAVDALALANHGTDRFGAWLPAHFTAWGYGQMSVLLSYCMAPLFRLFGMSAVTARLPALLWSLAGMGAFYALLRRLVSRRAALIGLLILAVNPWHFMQSRWALDCNLFPHVFLLGLALLLHGVKKPASLYGSMLFFALCMYCYGVAFVTVPLFLLGAALLLLLGRFVKLRRVLLCAGLYLVLSFPIYGTMLINAMGWETVALPFVTMPYFPQSVRSGDLIFFSPEPLKQLSVNARALWSVGFLQKPDLPWNAIDGFGTLYRCAWPLLLLGLGLSVARAFRAEDRRRRLGFRLLLLFWLCALVTGLCVNGVNVNRVNILFYAHLLFVAIGVHALVSFRRLSAVPLLAGFTLLCALFFFQYFGPWAERMDHVFYGDFLRAVEYADGEGFDRLIITPDVQYEGSRQVSEILTLYALQIDAEYFRGETDAIPAYRDRYRYRNLTAEDLAAPQENTAWVMKAGALPADLPRGWTLLDFGDYAVLYFGG